MIKIVCGLSYPVGSTIALVNLCNQLNSRGHASILYGPDHWHLDKCVSGTLHDFRPEDGDVIILHGIEPLSINDLHSPDSTVSAATPNHIWRSLWCAVAEVLVPASTPANFQLVMSCREYDFNRKAAFRYSLFNKIHFSGSEQKLLHKTKRPTFTCPDFLANLVPSVCKPVNTAGIIGTISKADATKEAIEKALADGMDRVILYGYLADPIYFYANIVPLTKSHPGQIKFAGFMDEPQKMYDSVSDVYASVNRPWSKVRRECALTNTRYHGAKTGPDENMTNEQIYQIWKSELGL